MCLLPVLVLSTCTQPNEPTAPPRTVVTSTPPVAVPPPAPVKLVPPESTDTPIPSTAPTTRVFPGTGVFVHPMQPIAGEAADTEAQPGDVTLNFADADVRDVVRSVLGDVLHLNYAVDPNVQAKITVQTARPLKREAVLPALQELLRASGLALVEAAGIYHVMPAEDAARSGAVPVTVGPSGARTPAIAPPTYSIQILPLKYVSAADVQRTVIPYVPKGDLLQVDATRNLIIISGAGSDLATLSQMIQSFDVDYLSGVSFAIVPLEYGSPKPLVEELRTMFGPQGSVPLAGLLSFEPLDDMNAILVISPQRAYLEQGRAWIERLDGGDADNTPRLFEYHVQNSRAADVAKVLSSLFGAGEVKTVQPQQTAPGTTPTQVGDLSMQSVLGQANGSGPGGPVPGLGGAPGGSSGLGSLTPQTGGGLPTAGGIAGPAVGGGPPPAPPSPSEAANAGNEGTNAEGQNGLHLPAVRIVADEKNNELVIFTTPHTYRMIADALKKIDVVPLQVLIEATVAEVTLNNDLQFGLQWFVQRGNNGFGFSNLSPFQTTTVNTTTVTTTTSSTTPTTTTATIPSIAGVYPGFNYVFGAGQANVVLSALSALTNVRVLSAPQLLVLDHGVANLEVGDEVPIPTAQIQSTLTAGAPLVNTIQYINTGVILHVSPRVNSSGLITLDITQEVSAPITTSTSSLDGPTIQQRRIESSVVVQDGQTIALGGLIQDSKSYTKNGIPLLSSIPVIGNLFSTTDNSDQRTELLVMLSPKIVRNAQEAQDMTNELRNRLHDYKDFSTP